MRVRYVLVCSNCGAAAADCVRLCPYCGQSTGLDDLGLKRSSDGGLVIEPGSALVVGAAEREERSCPFCGGRVPMEGRFCPHCREKVVIEQMRLASLEVKAGAGLRVHAGAQFEVIGRKRLPIHEASRKNDAQAVKAAVIDGDDPDHPDPRGLRPLHYAARSDAVDAARYLISVGADVEARDDDEQTALHEAARRGRSGMVDLLLMVSAEKEARNARGQTPGDLAVAARHDAIARTLERGTHA